VPQCQVANTSAKLGRFFRVTFFNPKGGQRGIVERAGFVFFKGPNHLPFAPLLPPKQRVAASALLPLPAVTLLAAAAAGAFSTMRRHTVR